MHATPHRGRKLRFKCLCGRKLWILRSVAANMIPGGLGTNEDMHVDLNARITVDATESHPMYSAFMSSTERGSTGVAEAQAPCGRRLITREVFGTLDPCE
jgi:hypothetical protein